MRIEELRINDIVKCKTDDNNVVRYISAMNNRGDIELNKIGGEKWETLEATISDIVPVEISDTTLKAIGAVKSPFTEEYILLVDKKEFFIKQDKFSLMWICSRLNKYRPPFVKVKYIHEIQRYLLETYMAILSF